MFRLLDGKARRRTIAAPISITGIGIHTGAPSSVTLLPGVFGEGIRFQRNGVFIPAVASCVVDTGRCTVLGESGQTISTIEHLLSACAGLGITDLSVEIDGPEVPIGDGSALVWVSTLQSVGLAEGEPLAQPTLSSPIVLTGKGGSFVAAYPSDVTRLTVAVSFEHPLVGTQIARFQPATGDYEREVAPARTFGFIEEVEALRAAGLAQGGSLDNAVVVYQDHYSDTLRFDDELARHKLLDLMGDMMLAGAQNLPVADIIAVKPSHRLNVAFAAALTQRFVGA